MEIIKIFIADDHTLIREGLKKLFFSQPEFKIVGETSNPFEITDMLRRTKPDVVLLDISMPGKSGLDVLKEIKTFSPNIHVLILTMLPEDQFAKRTLKAGASGYITKDSPPEELLNAIRRVASGKKYVSQTLAENLVDSLDKNNKKSPVELLSDREFQILKLIAAGNSQTDIAKQLSISISTVNTYRKRILDKLNFKNNTEMIHFALENNLLN